MSNSNYDDIMSASNNLQIISNELNNISYHLNKINEDLKISVRGVAGSHLTNRIIPMGIKKSKDLCEESSMIAKRLNILAKDLNVDENNVEDTDLNFL